MKLLKIHLIIIVLLGNAGKSYSQNINWNDIGNEERHIATVNTGLEYGLVFVVGYGYKLKAKKPVILNIEISVPSGKNVAENFKTKIEGQINYYTIKSLILPAVLKEYTGVMKTTLYGYKILEQRCR